MSFFPSSSRRGVRDLNKILRSILYGADGVVIQFQQNFVVDDHHPVCAAKDATRHLIGRAATPPRRGGEKSQPAQFSYVNITVIKNSRTKLGGNCRAILDTSGLLPL